MGPQIRRLRCKKGWSQEQLTAKLQLQGWDISRSALTKIENGDQVLCEFQSLYFAHVFRTPIESLWPPSFDPYASDYHHQITTMLGTTQRNQRSCSGHADEGN